jgi:hypothetical protein
VEAVVMALQKSSYSGALRTPIRFTKIPSPHFKTSDDVVKHEIGRKFALLLNHYKIDLNLPPERVFYSLAVNLAFAHVPGFKIVFPKSKGRKKKWDLAEARDLVAAVDAHRSSKGIRIKVAIGSAIKQKDWRWGRNTPSIETRYHEARRQIMRYKLAMRLPPLERLLAFGVPLSQRATKERSRQIS